MSQKMTISTKLIVGFGGLIALTAASGGFSYFSNRAISSKATELQEKQVPELKVATKLSDAWLPLNLAARTYAFTGDNEQRKSAEKALEQVRSALEEGKTLSARNAGEGQFTTAMNSASQSFSQYSQAIEQTIKAVESRTQVAKNLEIEAEEILTSLETATGSLTSQIETLTEEKAEPEQVAKIANLRASLNKLSINVLQLTTNAVTAEVKHDPKILSSALSTAQPAIEEQLKSLRTRTKGNPVQAEWAGIEEEAKAYFADLSAMVQALSSVSKANDVRRTSGEEFSRSVRLLLEGGIEGTSAKSSETASLVATTQGVLTITVLGSLLGGTVFGFFVTRSITKPIQRISGTLSTGADQTVSASSQVSSSSQSLAQGASEQAASLEETSSALEEMSSMTRKNSDTAQQAAALAAEAQSAANRGNESMNRMGTAINDIQRSAQETAKIIKVIDEIAFQTNLLALNAAVEAARAGEAGKGFAVVAEEVRNLAMRSAEAAKNTSSMIEESVGNAKNGVSIAQEVGKSLGEIVDASSKVTGLINEIAAATREQSQGIDQVNQSMSQMDKVTQQSAANAEETAAASEQLSAQAEQLRSCVSELSQLVGGQGETSSVVARSTFKPHSSSQRQRSSGTGSQLATTRTRGATPLKPKSKAKDLIPFDKEFDASAPGDFSEFNKAA